MSTSEVKKRTACALIRSMLTGRYPAIGGLVEKQLCSFHWQKPTNIAGKHERVEGGLQYHQNCDIVIRTDSIKSN